jgi:hypothetical protein
VTGPVPQLVRVAPELARATKLHRQILTLAHSRLDPLQHDTLRRLLGELTSAAWIDGYQAAQEETHL